MRVKLKSSLELGKKTWAKGTEGTAIGVTNCPKGYSTDPEQKDGGMYVIVLFSGEDKDHAVDRNKVEYIV